MAYRLSPLAGKPAPHSLLVDVGRLISAYANLVPDDLSPSSSQRVVFGTSGHRGTPFNRSFNESHIVAITQAICEFRHGKGIDGPLFIGIDTHALSEPAFRTAVEVLVANGVQTLVSKGGEFTPTPAVSLAILSYNRQRATGLADGIVVTPSHNPPDNGGFKYNPPHGGPADVDVTGWIEERANALLTSGLAEARRMPFERARQMAVVREHDFLAEYVGGLEEVIDFDTIRSSGLRLGVDPLGGAGVHYWPAIAERYGIDLTVTNDRVDPQFGFMTVDWDGQIRMDPSSPHAMQSLIASKDKFDVSFACDTDHDRHGVVSRRAALISANHYLAAMTHYLFRNRQGWPTDAGVGKTVVSTAMIDRVTRQLKRRLFETPVGFKWFSSGLRNGSLGFAGEESAGASFVKRDGSVWTTDKDGIAAALLAAEITARESKDPAELYQTLTQELGAPLFERVEATATPEQKSRLSKLSAKRLQSQNLAGDPVIDALDRAPGNNAPLGGVKLLTRNGWFAARPSGTEAIYKIYAESFRDAAHLQSILADAQAIVDRAIA